MTQTAASTPAPPTHPMDVAAALILYTCRCGGWMARTAGAIWRRDALREQAEREIQ